MQVEKMLQQWLSIKGKIFRERYYGTGPNDNVIDKAAFIKLNEKLAKI